MKEFKKELKKLVERYGVRSYFHIILGCVVKILLFPITIISYIMCKKDMNKMFYTFDEEVDKEAIEVASVYYAMLPIVRIYSFITGFDAYKYAKDRLTY